MLVFHFSPGTSSMAVHIALHEVGCAFETRVLSFHRTETRTPQFLKINPVGQVPVLEVDGRVLTEVAAILFYLARRYPEAGLLPAGDALPRPKSSRGCRSLRRRFIRRERKASSACGTSTRWPTGGWDHGTGRSGGIRSRTYICFDCSGDLGPR